MVILQEFKEVLSAIKRPERDLKETCHDFPTSCPRDSTSYTGYLSSSSPRLAPTSPTLSPSTSATLPSLMASIEVHWARTFTSPSLSLPPSSSPVLLSSFALAGPSLASVCPISKPAPGTHWVKVDRPKNTHKVCQQRRARHSRGAFQGVRQAGYQGINELRSEALSRDV